MPYIGGAPDFVQQCIENRCCEFWKDGCGLNAVFGKIADVLECVSPGVEQLGNLIWIFGSPLAFPIIFCFSSDPHTSESSGYEISMLEAPLRRPCVCLFSSVCFPCGQFFVRRAVLDYDMTKYKLWQGQHDGPQCFARVCPSAPITIQSGTYGEQNCPNLFLCLEVSVLGCYMSSCCAFDVSRRYQREERGLDIDPTEQKHQTCIQFFSQIMHNCCMLGCCVGTCSCCVGLCAPDSEGAQECAGDGGRAARACCRIAHILWKGIMWTRIIGMGCMSAQMIHEAETPYDKSKQGPKARPEFLIKPDAPTKQVMADRGGPSADDDATRTTTSSHEPNEIKFPWESKKKQHISNLLPSESRRQIQQDRKQQGQQRRNNQQSRGIQTPGDTRMDRSDSRYEEAKVEDDV